MSSISVTGISIANVKNITYSSCIDGNKENVWCEFKQGVVDGIVAGSLGPVIGLTSSIANANLMFKNQSNFSNQSPSQDLKQKKCTTVPQNFPNQADVEDNLVLGGIGVGTGILVSILPIPGCQAVGISIASASAGLLANGLLDQSKINRHLNQSQLNQGYDHE